MKKIILSVVSCLLIAIIVKCDDGDMDNTYAIRPCPRGIWDGGQICNQFGTCEISSSRNGCVQLEGFNKCTACQPPSIDSNMVSSNDTKYASLSQEDVEMKPLYSSSMNSLESITTGAVIGSNKATSFYTGSCEAETYSYGYLDRYYYKSVSGDKYASQSGSRIIKPVGNEVINLSEGTLSLWLRLRTIGKVNKMSSQAASRIFGENQSVLQLYFVSYDGSDIVCHMYINNIEVATKIVANNNGWFHVYVIWGDGILDGKTMKIFINKKEAITYSEVLPDMSSFNFIASLDGYVLAHGKRKCETKYKVITKCKNFGGGSNSSASMSNLKLWNTIVSEDPEAEYNN